MNLITDLVYGMVFHFHMQRKQCSSDNPKAEQYTAKALGKFESNPLMSCLQKN